jgi:3-methyl-2-oxobutanoate hydroxymethyltransferase
MMLTHCEAVKRGNQNQFLIGDMPFLSYQLSNTDAIRNAGEFVRSGMDAVKLEGHFPERIKAIADSGTLIMAHLGLTPQTQARLGGYRVQAKTGQEIDQLLQQAKSVEQSGASLLLLEAVPAEVAEMVRNELNIPVYGIGAGPKVDGQLAIIHDLLGLFWDFKPKFIKQYVNGEEVFLKAIQEYAKEVVETKFPTDSQSYHLQEEALDALLARSGSSWKYEKAG